MDLERIGLKWIEIDLDQFRHNIQSIQKYIYPSKIIPVLKANAYGHGSITIARQLESLGIHTIAVATLQEAILLRQHFIKMKILLLGAIPENQVHDILNYQITPTLCDLNFARCLSKKAKEFGQDIPYHLYVDTGMGRMGQKPLDIQNMFDEIKKLPFLKLEAIYSHFSVSDETDDESKNYTKQQCQKIQEWAIQHKSTDTYLHIANSGAIVQHKYTFADAVRPGLLCYGISPCNEKNLALLDIKPILSLKCRPLYIKAMHRGDHIGYGRSAKLKRDTYIMTLPVGYADGIPRRIAPFLKVSIQGKLFPIIGRVCMDMMMVDIGNTPLPSDIEVTLMGDTAHTIYDWTQNTDTIPYEILTQLGSRWDHCYRLNGSIHEIVRSSS